MAFCEYYQAEVQREKCWFLTGALRSFEHMSFDRTINVENSTFEFFVPKDQQKDFEFIIQYFIDNGIVKNLRKLENRLKTEEL